jgi:ATP-binding cassette subfamily F protein 3
MFEGRRGDIGTIWGTESHAGTAAAWFGSKRKTLVAYGIPACFRLHFAPMLSFRDVSLRRGGRELFNAVSFTIYAGQKVGLTGANGSGKSSLLALIRAELAPERGDVELPTGITIAHVAQETPADPRPALEYVLDGDVELRRIEAAIAEATNSGGTRLGELHAQLAAIDGYAAPARAAKLLAGLGFAVGSETEPVAAFSGGWRMRLNLARALMRRADLLLLDEPTNHLDLDAVIWLEDWLLGFQGTLLIISHDRDFLDRVVSVIAHIEHGGIRLYTGNYTAFESARAAQLAGQQAAFLRQQREIQHMRAFVERFRYKASKARQAQSRLKALARLETIAPAHVDSPFGFSFRAPRKLPQPLITLDRVAAGYGPRRVLDSVGLALMPGDRIALLGANGAGKSTLIKLLAGELAPQAGELTRAQDLVVGYFAQHQLEQLDPDGTPLQHLRRVAADTREQELRDFLGGFDFRGPMVERTVGTFSGGEKARLVLALLLYARPNVLLLDEPTNHLDLDMRHALTIALQEFTGALVLVAHDRHLLRTTADTLLLVHDGALSEWHSDLDDYAAWLVGGRREHPGLDQPVVPAAPTPVAVAETLRVNDRERRQRAAQRRARLRPLHDAVRRAESELERAQHRRDEIAARLVEPALYEASQREILRELMLDRARVDQEIAAAEAAWLLHSEHLENAERAADGE